MRQYLDLLGRILHTGTQKHPTRKESGKTENPTIGLPNLHFSHHLSQGFPLLTTREINFKSMVGELRSFIEGQSTNRGFEENGCKFWRPWADNLVSRGKSIRKNPDDSHYTPAKSGDLGPIYGVQWNRHGQLAHVLDCLRNRPTDRRMVVSAWRPDEHDQMALPPCHLGFVVTPYNGFVNLSWFQRSCDFPIGVPYNIASYALLTHLFAKWAGMLPGLLGCIFCDAHIYENQIDGVVEQIGRIPALLPKVLVEFSDPDDFRSWDVTLTGWNPQPNISFGKVEV